MDKKNNDKTKMFLLSDLYCACYWVREQYKQYIKYKENMCESNKEMETLHLLEELGYPIEEMGTYFYKDMILKIVEYLENIENEFESNKYHELLDELDNHFSHFYFDLARNELDVGIKTFHGVLANEISNIDHSNANSEKFDEVFGSTAINNLGYEKKAFIIGTHMYLNKKTNKAKVKNNIKVSMHK